MVPKVYIIILNYLNWKDTIECLVSLELLDYQSFEVVVIDNFSANESSLKIQEYIFSHPTLSMHFLQSPENGGFAKGNNLGLEFATSKGDGKYYWLLNNDTVVEKDSLKHLIKKAEIDKQGNLKIGLYGSKLKYYHNRDLIQAVGASYNKWTGFVKEIGNGENDTGQYDTFQNTDFLPGASFIITNECIKEIGFMNEKLFLYFEELDWAQRALKKRWQIRLVPESVVFHKHGASIQSSGLNKNEKSAISDFYFLRNKLYITKKYFPYCLPSVYFASLFTIANRLLRGQANRIPMFLKIFIRFDTITWNDISK